MVPQTNIPQTNIPQTNPTNPDEIKRDLQATLAARRELGTAYDQHFIDALSEKLTAQVQQQVQQQVRATLPRTTQRPAQDQRLALAICSLIFSIPLIAIASGSFGVFGFLAICLMIVGINVAFAIMP